MERTLHHCLFFNKIPFRFFLRLGIRLHKRLERVRFSARTVRESRRSERRACPVRQVQTQLAGVRGSFAFVPGKATAGGAAGEPFVPVPTATVAGGAAFVSAAQEWATPGPRTSHHHQNTDRQLCCAMPFHHFLSTNIYVFTVQEVLTTRPRPLTSCASPMEISSMLTMRGRRATWSKKDTVL